MAEPQMRTQYVIRHSHRTETFDDKDIAVRRVNEVLGELAGHIDPLAEFSESVMWDMEDVPATPFDEFLVEYEEAAGVEDVDRNHAYLMVERNVRGSSPPFVLSSADTVQELYVANRDQEYADDWSLEGIYETATGNEVDFDVTVTVKVKA